MLRSCVTIGAVLSLLCAGSVWLFRANWIAQKIEAVQNPRREGVGTSTGCLPNKGKSLLMIGDSRILQWPARLLAPTVCNDGRAGETVAQMSLRFHADLLSFRPSAVLISSGVNDLVAASFMSASEGERIVVAVADALIGLGQHAAGSGADAYVATIIPAGRPSLLRRAVWSATLVDYVEEVNGRLRAHPWQGRARLLDLAAEVAPEGVAILPEIYRRDTLHVNALGYCRLIRALPPAFQGRAASEDAC